MPLCRIIYRQFALIGRFCHKFLIQAIPAGADIPLVAKYRNPPVCEAR